MAADLFTLLSHLQEAFPEKPLSKATLQRYHDHLADIPLQILERAINRLVETSRYFPRIAELRQAALQLTTDQGSTPPPGYDFLYAEYRQLDHQYFRHALFEPGAWEHLATQLDRLGRLHFAAELRQRSSYIRADIAASQKGEATMPTSLRLKYQQWDCQSMISRGGQPGSDG